MKLPQNTLSRFLCLLPLVSSVLPAHAVIYEQKMPEEQKRMMEEDFDAFSRLNIVKDDTAEVKRIFNIRSRVSSSSLRKWLDERVKMIVPQEWDANDAKIKVEIQMNYPKADVRPAMDRPKKTASNGKGTVTTGQVMVVMSNTGTGLYLNGKFSKMQMTLGVNGVSYPVKSPRLGLIQVGQGYFYSYYFGDSAGKPSTLPTRLNRLSTLFHEARHSDGNGVSVGFLHAVCPDEMTDYGGYPACDRSLNGSYTVGALITKVMANACEGCSTVEKDKLRARSLDSYSRVLESTQELIDPKAIESIQDEVTDCYLAKSLGGKVADGCATILERLKAATATKSVPTALMDPTPESL